MLPTQGSRDRLRVGVRLPARARCRRPGSFAATSTRGRGRCSRRRGTVVSRFEGGEQLGAQPSGGKAASIRVWISARRLLAPAEPGSPLPRHGQGTAWRIELVAGRWQLSRYSPAGDTWQRAAPTPPATRRSTPPTARRTARRLAADHRTHSNPAHAFGAGALLLCAQSVPLAPVDDLAGACRSQKFWWRSCASTRTCLGRPKNR
jgi:hypothetical protein